MGTSLQQQPSQLKRLNQDKLTSDADAVMADPSTNVKVELPDEALQLAHALLAAAQQGTIYEISGLLDRGAPAWYQDDDLGWSCLHYAAERREPALLRKLLSGGAVWNAVDHWGRTAGEICLSLGDKEGWEVIRNEGVRAEMLHHALREANKLKAAEEKAEGAKGEKGDENMTVEPGEGPEGAQVTQSGDGITLRNHDESSAGDNLAFLSSKLTWEVGDDGRERVLDADGNGVMMGWEEPLSEYGPPKTPSPSELRFSLIKADPQCANTSASWRRGRTSQSSTSDMDSASSTGSSRRPSRGRTSSSRRIPRYFSTCAIRACTTGRT